MRNKKEYMISGLISLILMINLIYVNGSTMELESDTPTLYTITPTIDTDGIIVLHWSAVSGAISYQIARSKESGLYSNIATVSGTSYTDPGILGKVGQSVVYNYKVRVIDPFTGAGYSNIQSVTVSLPSEGSPTFDFTGLIIVIIILSVIGVIVGVVIYKSKTSKRKSDESISERKEPKKETPEGMKYCSTCGEKIKKQATYCEFCGSEQ